MSETGTVATFGGIQLPSVAIFMDGFADGVAKYNEDNGTDVQLLGWDKEAQEGAFSGDFENQSQGQTLTEQFLAQGADIIMPVAGGAGLGTTAAAKASNGKYSVIWVDVDGCQSTQDCSVLLNTVAKNITGAVKEAVLKGAAGEKLTDAEPYVGTLANDGVGLSGFNEFEEQVPAGLKSELDEIKAQFDTSDLDEAQLHMVHHEPPTVGTIFPNLSMIRFATPAIPGGPISVVTSFRQWQPVGPGQIELWSWQFVWNFQDEESAQQDYVTGQFVFGSAGIFEQDDTVAWEGIPRAAASPWACKSGMSFNFQQGNRSQVDQEPREGWTGPGRLRPTGYGEHNQLEFYRHWLKVMREEPWQPSEYTRPAITVGEEH